MSKMNCDTCKWFKATTDSGAGICRRYPPNLEGLRPFVMQTDLCGEYKYCLDK